MKANINKHAACKCCSVWTHPTFMETSRINLSMLDASKLKYIFHCDGLVIKVFLQFPQLRFLKVNIHELAACKCGRFCAHSAVMQTSLFNLFAYV